ncbi:MAG: PD-(D/E)XK nuclease family protein [Thermoplasmatales archaeon]
MDLRAKEGRYIIPEYSITGDILSFQKCGLQYRYQNKGELPPSKPVQLWFGQFIHGVMEEAYLKWSRGSNVPSFPWDWNSQVRNIEVTVFKRLMAGGLRPPRWIFCPYDSPNATPGSCPDINHPHRLIASERVLASINTWGPHLFPLISEAEIKLKGTRPMPNYNRNISRSNYYGITGIIDVIASVNLQNAEPNNLILKKIEEASGGRRFIEEARTEKYEVIIDYKGSARPNTNDQEWNEHQDQVLTYTWLREKQPGFNKVKIGIVFYLNELVYSKEDMQRWKEFLRGPGQPQTDVQPTGNDLSLITKWQTNSDPPKLSEGFKLNRSIRVIIVDRQKIEESLARNDAVVASIESSARNETSGTPIVGAWRATPEVETCTICDFKTFCPKSADTRPPSVSNAIM